MEPVLDHWPRLSETLPHREPGRCASCGTPEVAPVIAGLSGAVRPTLITWQEHDWRDRPEPRYVTLCRPCSDRLIEPHPRLYAALNPYTPAPGAMAPLCSDCVHREGTRCVCPRARANGGEGIHIFGPAPADVHVCRRGKGQRSGWEKWYPGPSTRCDGKDVTACVDPIGPEVT